MEQPQKQGLTIAHKPHMKVCHVRQCYLYMPFILLESIIWYYLYMSIYLLIYSMSLYSVALGWVADVLEAQSCGLTIIRLLEWRLAHGDHVEGRNLVGQRSTSSHRVSPCFTQVEALKKMDHLSYIQAGSEFENSTYHGLLESLAGDGYPSI